MCFVFIRFGNGEKLKREKKNGLKTVQIVSTTTQRFKPKKYVTYTGVYLRLTSELTDSAADSKEAKQLFRTQHNTCSTHSRLVYNENSLTETRTLIVADPRADLRSTGTQYRTCCTFMKTDSAMKLYNPLLILIIIIY